MAGRQEIRADLKGKAKGAPVAAVQEYLERFGYLSTSDPERDIFGAPAFPQAKGDDLAALAGRPDPGKKGTLDKATADAIRRFQAFANLPVTGVVDEATAAKMNQPRCSNADPTPLDEFTTTGRKWATNNLRYAFENFTADIDSGTATLAIEQALAVWAAYTPLRFSRVAMSGGPEIIIRFVSGDHGDGFPFDGPSGVLAHAFYPSTPARAGDGDHGRRPLR